MKGDKLKWQKRARISRSDAELDAKKRGGKNILGRERKSDIT
jgi:hypothetical protein